MPPPHLRAGSPTNRDPHTPDRIEGSLTDPSPPGHDAADLREDLRRALGPTITLGRELPRGGMSRVFEGFDEALQRKLAVKVLAPDLAESLSVERFRREIMLVASLQHPNIVPVLSAGDVGGLPYFVMPFVEGESLRERLMRGPLSVRETVGIMRDVARALSLAHERGIVHRDIKPDNVMLTGGVAAVADFGVAKALAAAHRPGRGDDDASTPSFSTLTSVGTAIGTPAYMAPEQAAGDPHTDHRADLYSLGILGYEMLSGAPPFRERSLRRLMAAQLAGTATPIERRRADVPSELGGLIRQCLEKSPDDRPRTATAVVRVLENPDLVSGAHLLPQAKRPQRFVTRARLGWASVSLAAVAAAAWGLWPTLGSDTPDPVAVRATVLVPTIQSAAQNPDARAQDLAIAEQIVAGLSRMGGVRVAGPPMADSMKPAPLPDSAAARGRTLRLEGLLQRNGAQTRLSVRLLDESGFTVWGDTFRFSDTDPLVLQDRVSAAVLTALVPRLRALLGIAEDGEEPPTD